MYLICFDSPRHCSIIICRKARKLKLSRLWILILFDYCDHPMRYANTFGRIRWLIQSTSVVNMSLSCHGTLEVTTFLEYLTTNYFAFARLSD